MPLLYLASQSPRRRQLLDQIGVAHELLLPDADEDAEALEVVLAGETPDDYVQRVTAAKLDAALQRRERRQWPPAPVLCADTTVTLDGDILGKPDNAAHALAMLRRLSGREHRVLTAVALGLPDGRSLAALSVSTVRFDPVPDDRLQAYVNAGEPMGKAGSYAIQSHAAAWISHIAGSYSGIMGLPLFETAGLLRAAGWVL
ncbi:Maf family protein [Roseateles sp. SL47]|uniref:Maf family protein n=1 Tax=Roseateles sp. SL47 TaxID=2995138 RepID=UPI002271428D|nr:Maf family protein [Roseateles sp. SL47]WAC75601.1 Maf family protein [Roseateles sp. SL47]